MAKWSYLRRAYAIQEYAYYRSIQFANYQTPEEEHAEETRLDTLPEVLADVQDILAMSLDNYKSARETPYEYKTIRQCRKFLADFAPKEA